MAPKSKTEVPFGNEDEETPEKIGGHTLFEGNIFYMSKEGIKHHLKVTQESDTGVLTPFMGLLESAKVRIINDGGTPDSSFGSKFATAPAPEKAAPGARRKAASPETPMEQAASDMFPGSVERECPNGCAGTMEYVPGTDVHGRLSKKGNSYSSSYVCKTCDKRLWLNPKKAE